jgi:hypothetical protein
VAYGFQLPLCIQCEPCLQTGLNGILRPGESLQEIWHPKNATCLDWRPSPGVYEVRWAGFPGDVTARFEMLPHPAREVQVSVEPGEARFGEEVQITVENTSSSTLTYNACCAVPEVLDPEGRSSHCYPCPECFQVEELAPGEILTFDWTAGKNYCLGGNLLPGLHRIIWRGLFGGPSATGIEYFGETSILISPPRDRYLELELSSSEIRPGGTLRITATNPLDVSVWHGGCCDTSIIIDALGHLSPCEPCMLDCVPIRNNEIAPGKSISRELSLGISLECGLRPGPCTLLWGPNFALVPGMDPAPPVQGMAEILVLPAGEEPSFLRGNCDGEGDLNLTDIINLLGYLFQGEGEPPCLKACDGDDSGSLDLTDAIYLLNFLYLGGLPPPEPYPNSGPDPTPDALSCHTD